MNQSIDQITITLKDDRTGNLLPVYINVHENSLSCKWLTALNDLIRNNYHLEKNYCFLGFIESARNAEYIMAQVNHSISAINLANLGYQIDDYFSVANTITPDADDDNITGPLIHDKLNLLHRYFEDLQGVSGHMSEFYNLADNRTRWHIRQLNLLCHEYESLVLSMRKAVHAPEWRRPSQLMCWLNAPRFTLDETDYELFGIETINRPLGGVFVGVNKAVGKHHYEVFTDEGMWGTNIDELTTSTLKSQTEAAGDFDIEWANDPGAYHWQIRRLAEFRQWLINNGINPDEKRLTIGHPQVGQVDLDKSFGSTNYQDIWQLVGSHLNVYSIKTGDAEATYNYNWLDTDYIDQQVRAMFKTQ